MNKMARCKRDEWTKWQDPMEDNEQNGKMQTDRMNNMARLKQGEWTKWQYANGDYEQNG